jgi:nitroreductase
MDGGQFMTLLRARRSVRAFAARPIEAEKVELLKEAVLRSPSSRNLDPWSFVFVDDKELLAKLSTAKPHGAAFLKGAALGIVVCADASVCDVWVEDCAIASLLAQLAAQSLGLASCWIQLRLRQHRGGDSSEAYVRQVLGLPDSLNVESIIAIGYPAEHPRPIPLTALKHERIHRNQWGQPQ